MLGNGGGVLRRKDSRGKILGADVGVYLEEW